VRAVLDVLDEVELARPARTNDLLVTVAAGMARLVSADTVWWATCDYARHDNDVHSSDARLDIAYDERQRRWWQLYEQHPLLAYRDRTGDGRACTLSDFVGRRDLRGLELYDEFFRPYGIEYSVSIRVPLSAAYAVDFGYTRAGRDFSWRDRVLLDLIRPTLAQLLARTDAVRHARMADARLTAREREILDLVAEGKTNPEVAAHLVIAPGTVKKHLDHIYEKLGVENRTQAGAAISR